VTVDYYELLGVEPDASLEEIHRAYRQRVKGCHPDRVADLDAELRRLAEQKMMELNEAHRVLRDSKLRARYDARRAKGSGPETPPPHTPHTPHTPRAERPAAGTAETNGRQRIAGQELVVRAAADQLRTRVMDAGRNHSWADVDAEGLSVALEGRRGLKRDVILATITGTLDEAGLAAALRRFHARARTAGSSLWRRESVHGFAGAVHFVHLDRLTRVVERFNETQSGDGRPVRAALVDVVQWTAAPAPHALDDHLRFLKD
jgi:curved DNA-binding protein CbpA